MKKVPPEGDYIDGMFVPGGTRIGHNMVGMQQSKEIFGPDYQLFRPERWLGQTPERLRELTTTTEMIFGAGRWACLGKSVAFTQLNKVIFEVSWLLSFFFGKTIIVWLPMLPYANTSVI